MRIQKYFGSSQSPKFPEWRSEWKTSEAYEETAYFEGKSWNDLSVNDFETHTCCHSFFPDDCALYYLGANMYLEYRTGNFLTMAMDRLLMDLDLVGEPIRARRKLSTRIETLWKRMNDAQKSTMFAYLDSFTERDDLHVKEERALVQGYRDALQRL